MCKKEEIKYGSILPENYDNIQTIISVFTMAEDAILYSLSLADLIKNHIGSSCFKKVILPEYCRKINWNEHPEPFLEQTENLPMAVFAFEFVKCAEGYFDLSPGKVVDPLENSDLHASQVILRIIRNSCGHPLIQNNQLTMRWNVKNKEYKKRFEVKEIGIVLDARELDGKEFKLQELGGEGWDKLFILLNYLKRDLRTKL